MPAAYPTTVSSTYTSAGTALPNCSRPLKESVKSNDLIFTADSGHEQRRQKSAPRRVFDIQYNALLKDQYYTIRDFYLSVTTTTPFLWTHPVDKTPYLVRFTNDTFTASNTKHGPKGPIYEIQFSLMQVWS